MSVSGAGVGNTGFDPTIQGIDQGQSDGVTAPGGDDAAALPQRDANRLSSISMSASALQGQLMARLAASDAGAMQTRIGEASSIEQVLKCWEEILAGPLSENQALLDQCQAKCTELLKGQISAATTFEQAARCHETALSGIVNEDDVMGQINAKYCELFRQQVGEADTPEKLLKCKELLLSGLLPENDASLEGALQQRFEQVMTREIGACTTRGQAQELLSLITSGAFDDPGGRLQAAAQAKLQALG